MRQNRRSIVLGVTGGIGSGKSTVSHILEEFGVVIIDADAISREIVEPGEQALGELAEAFGRDIIDEAGRLKRKLLAALVFNDKQNLQIINDILHKYVAQRIKDYVEEQFLRKTDVIVIDAPIPIKTGFLDLCDKVWTVTAPMELRIERVMKRSAMTREEAISRINSQIPEEDYIKIADTVIYNDKDIKKLNEEVRHQFNALLGGLIEKKY
jgi:dephospho-CoA kinase